jgi:hypothetical protein
MKGRAMAAGVQAGRMKPFPSILEIIIPCIQNSHHL